MGAMASQITGFSIVCPTVCSGARKTPRHWSLWGESTGDRWIAFKRQVTRKCFHLMTSSCCIDDVDNKFSSRHILPKSRQHSIYRCRMRHALRWRHIGRDSISNHQPHDCLLNGLFRRRSKKTSKLRVTGLCEGNPPATGGFPSKGQVTWKCFHLMTSSCCINEVDNKFSSRHILSKSRQLSINRCPTRHGLLYSTVIGPSRASFSTLTHWRDEHFLVRCSQTNTSVISDNSSVLKKNLVNIWATKFPMT